MTASKPHISSDFDLVREVLVAQVRMAQPFFDSDQHTSLPLAALERIEEQVNALNAENAKLNAENRDLLEKWSARGGRIDSLEEQQETLDESAKRTIAAQHEFTEELKAKLQEAERERDEALLPSVEEVQAIFTEMRLREALGAYRSALRSGERESPQLVALGDAALATANPEATE